jgi:nickel-dependent lactate racemase
MFPACPREKFIAHNWRADTVELGRLEASWVEQAFGGGEQFRMDFPIQVNSSLLLPTYSLLISIGQVVPHEVAGMANHLKNIFVGCGGAEAIHKSHYLGALWGLERLMGVAENPVRRLFDESYARFADKLPPIFWVLTVVGQDNVVRGLCTGFGREPFEKAAALAAKVNITRLPAPLKKIVVRLDPAEYRSTWLGNKAIYRTRMAIASGGELTILAPGVDRFGEDPALDALIRRHGYRGRDAVVRAAANDPELAASLSAAAHLIHGSGEGRFTIRYCPGPRGLSKEEIEGVGFRWGDLEKEQSRAGQADLVIENPALGLWKV